MSAKHPDTATETGPTGREAESVPPSPRRFGEVIGFTEPREGAPCSRWHRPLATHWDRFSAWMNMLFVDHGIFRAIWSNTWTVSDNAWRSSQPLPHLLRRFARAGGRTVVTLRGGQTFGSFPLEIEACEKSGMILRSFVLRSRGLPSREHIMSMKGFFESIEYPVLFHCKSGADRAGLMAAIYLVFAEGRLVSEARRQLGLKFGHIRLSKTGVLDALFDAYQADTANTPISLEEWIETRYDPETITNSFHASGFWSLVVDKVLRRE